MKYEMREQQQCHENSIGRIRPMGPTLFN